MNLPDMKSSSVTSSTTEDSKQPPKVLIAVLSTFERHGWHHPSITTFIHTLRFNHDYATNYVPVMNYSPAASGRNIVCKHFMESTAEWACLIDNDMEVPMDILDTIKNVPEDAGIVVPMFYLWDQSKPAITLCWGMPLGSKGTKVEGDKEYWQSEPGFHELTKCGTGVIFIKREALEKIPYPWFKYKYNEDQAMVATEDIMFCYAAREAGVKIYGNSNENVRCGHYHQVNLLVVSDMMHRGLGLSDIRKNGDNDADEVKAHTRTEDEVEQGVSETVLGKEQIKEEGV